MNNHHATIFAEGLSKKYNGSKAIENLSLNVAPGEIYGFLGPNGAGKTTTIMLLLRILKPSGGRIFMFGEDLRSAGLDLNKRIGVVSETPCIYKEMTASEYLHFFADLYRVQSKSKKIDEYLEKIELTHVKHKRLGTFSRGMQQKIGFARAFLHDPDLFILDEPISGLDPRGVKQIRDLIASENKRGKTFFISSHLLSEVEKLCHKVAIINKGNLLAEEKMEDLRKRFADLIEIEIELSSISESIADHLRQLDFVKELSVDQKNLIIKVPPGKEYRPEISAAISSRGGTILGIKLREMSLEDAFMTITSQNISLLLDSHGKL